MNQPQSQLARYAAKPATSDAQILAMGARAYHDQETLVVRISQIRDPMWRKMAHALAKHIFGEPH